MSPLPIDIVGLTRRELAEKLDDGGFEPAIVKPLWNWMYVKGATDLSQIPSISRSRSTRLAEHFRIGRPGVARRLTSRDATRKWLLQFPDHNRVETVLIPEIGLAPPGGQAPFGRDGKIPISPSGGGLAPTSGKAPAKSRGALCVSSQVGCTLACSFCHTGTMKLVRNLTAGEIVGQVMIARDDLSEWGRNRADCFATNIVLMGMGEPLFNFENVATALRIIMDGDGIGISRRRIMLSTAGVVPFIERVGRELGVNLAISLHAVRDDLRDELVPLNRKYPLRELLQACRDYPSASNARRITFEYVMLNGINDSDADARELTRLLQGIHAKVNLIPWNPWPGAGYENSTAERIRAFAGIINDAGYSAAVRAVRGDDIMAACGQLKSDSER